MELAEKVSACLFLLLLAVALLLAKPASEGEAAPDRLDTVAVTGPSPVAKG